MIRFLKKIITILKTIWMIFLHSFRRRETVLYPEEKPYLPPRYRGRPILTLDPNGAERCVACGLCAVVCPSDCIAMQKTEDKSGRAIASRFQLNVSRCVFCGMCEEACPTSAIQLSPDFELGDFKRSDLLYEKDDLLISGCGKDPSYNFFEVSEKKSSLNKENEPVNIHSLLP